MTISVIVPIYKVEAYLRQCVDSILAQTYTDLDIVLVDDGSTDNCPAICDAYARKDARVQVVHKPNGGLMSARQAGLRVAKGDYVGFVDGDDWIESDMYARFASAIDRYTPDMALCEFYYAFADHNEPSTQHLQRAYYTKAQLAQEIYPTMLYHAPYYSFGINPCCWSKVFKKELLEQYQISYGALYRWKRMGLIPESWFLRRSTPSGQETYFHTKQICLRVERILESKERVSLDALAEELAGQKQAAAARRTLVLETKYGAKTYSLDELLHLYLTEGEHKTDILEHLKEEAL